MKLQFVIFKRRLRFKSMKLILVLKRIFYITKREYVTLYLAFSQVKWIY